MTFKVTTLLENSRIENEKLATEHGLSFFIEIGEPVQRRILFDTGQSGGFKEFVEAYGAAFELFVGEGFFTPKYAWDTGQWRFLGNDVTAEYLHQKEIGTTVLREDVLESDEVVIVVQTNKGLLVLLGCSHPGVANRLCLKPFAANRSTLFFKLNGHNYPF